MKRRELRFQNKLLSMIKKHVKLVEEEDERGRNIVTIYTERTTYMNRTRKMIGKQTAKQIDRQRKNVSYEIYKTEKGRRQKKKKLSLFTKRNIIQSKSETKSVKDKQSERGTSVFPSWQGTLMGYTSTPFVWAFT